MLLTFAFTLSLLAVAYAQSCSVFTTIISSLTWTVFPCTSCASWVPYFSTTIVSPGSTSRVMSLSCPESVSTSTALPPSTTIYLGPPVSTSNASPTTISPSLISSTPCSTLTTVIDSKTYVGDGCYFCASSWVPFFSTSGLVSFSCPGSVTLIPPTATTLSSGQTCFDLTLNAQGTPLSTLFCPCSAGATFIPTSTSTYPNGVESPAGYCTSSSPSLAATPYAPCGFSQNLTAACEQECACTTVACQAFKALGGSCADICTRAGIFPWIPNVCPSCGPACALNGFGALIEYPTVVVPNPYPLLAVQISTIVYTNMAGSPVDTSVISKTTTLISSSTTLTWTDPRYTGITFTYPTVYAAYTSFTHTAASLFGTRCRTDQLPVTLNAPTTWASLIFPTSMLAYPHLPTPLINYFDRLPEVLSQVGSTIDSNCDPLTGPSLMTAPSPTDTITTAAGTSGVTRLTDTTLSVPTEAGGQKQGGDSGNIGTQNGATGGGGPSPTGQGTNPTQGGNNPGGTSGGGGGGTNLPNTVVGPTSGGGAGATGQGNRPTIAGSIPGDTSVLVSNGGTNLPTTAIGNSGSGIDFKTSTGTPASKNAGSITNPGTVLTPGSGSLSGAIASPTGISGDYFGSVTWPAGCESWANPCPSGAPISGGGHAGGDPQTTSGIGTSEFVMWYPLTDASGSSTSFLITVPRITVARITITVTSMFNNRTNITTTRNLTMTQTSTFSTQGQSATQITAWAERMKDFRLGLIGSLLATALTVWLFWL